MTYERPDSWDLNIGGFERHYRPKGWLVSGSTGPHGWIAQHLDPDGRPTKGMRPVAAMTLDELAEKIEAEEGSVQE